MEGGGRIDFRKGYYYTKQEALAAFTRVAGQHGWIARDPSASQTVPTSPTGLGGKGRGRRGGRKDRLQEGKSLHETRGALSNTSG